MSRADQVDGILGGLSSPTAEDVYLATDSYDARALAAAAARRALAGGGGGGGSQTGLVFAAPTVLDDCKWGLVASDAERLAYDYDNGPDNDGVGSTITCQDDELLGASGVDNLTGAQVGDRVAVADPPAGFFGIFTVTDLGGEASPWVLTRATDADTVETFVQVWAVRITSGDVFDGGMLRVLNVEFPLDEQSVESFGSNGRFMVQGSIGGIAFGAATSSYGFGSFAAGSTAEASAAGSFALGGGAIASAQNATAIGNNVVANVENSTVISSQALFLRNLPTDDPLVVGQIWADNGVLTVSAGAP